MFRLQLKNQNVKVGETVVLRCKLKLTEIPPTITWFKNGHVIQAGHEHYKIHLFRHSSRLKIRRIKIKDAGKYTCQASNYISNISSHSRIVVSPPTSSSKKKFLFVSFTHVWFSFSITFSLLFNADIIYNYFIIITGVFPGSKKGRYNILLTIIAIKK